MGRLPGSIPGRFIYLSHKGGRHSLCRLRRRLPSQAAQRIIEEGGRSEFPWEAIEMSVFEFRELVESMVPMWLLVAAGIASASAAWWIGRKHR